MCVRVTESQRDLCGSVAFGVERVEARQARKKQHNYTGMGMRAWFGVLALAGFVCLLGCAAQGAAKRSGRGVPPPEFTRSSTRSSFLEAGGKQEDDSCCQICVTQFYSKLSLLEVSAKEKVQMAYRFHAWRAKGERRHPDGRPHIEEHLIPTAYRGKRVRDDGIGHEHEEDHRQILSALQKAAEKRNEEGVPSSAKAGETLLPTSKRQLTFLQMKSRSKMHKSGSSNSKSKKSGTASESSGSKKKNGVTATKKSGSDAKKSGGGAKKASSKGSGSAKKASNAKKKESEKAGEASKKASNAKKKESKKAGEAAKKASNAKKKESKKAGEAAKKASNAKKKESKKAGQAAKKKSEKAGQAAKKKSEKTGKAAKKQSQQASKAEGKAANADKKKSKKAGKAAEKASLNMPTSCPPPAPQPPSCPPQSWRNRLAPAPRYPIPSEAGKPPKCCDLCPADFRADPITQPNYLGIERRVWDSKFAAGDAMARLDKDEKPTSEAPNSDSNVLLFIQRGTEHTAAWTKKSGGSKPKRTSSKSGQTGKKSSGKSGQTGKKSSGKAGQTGKKSSNKSGDGAPDSCPPRTPPKKQNCPRVTPPISRVTLKPCCAICPASMYKRVDYDDYEDAISLLERDMKSMVPPSKKVEKKRVIEGFNDKDAMKRRSERRTKRAADGKAESSNAYMSPEENEGMKEKKEEEQRKAAEKEKAWKRTILPVVEALKQRRRRLQQADYPTKPCGCSLCPQDVFGGYDAPFGEPHPAIPEQSPFAGDGRHRNIYNHRTYNRAV